MPPMLATILHELGIPPALIEARGLRAFPEAERLVEAEMGDDGRLHRLVPEVALAWRSMKAAALNDGVALRLVSAFRSVERQAEIVRHKLARGEVVVDVLKVCAPPGFSEHHSGCAVDLSVSGEVPLQPGFAQTPAYAWLTAHAADFDFYLSFPEGNPQGYAFEPWHWCHRSASAV